jgi:hypothetical protein
MRLVFGIAALAVLALPATPALAQQVLVCNSTIDLSVDPSQAQVFDTVGVTITVQNGPSFDAVGNPDDQQFDVITYFPACSSTQPCVFDVDGAGNPPVEIVGGSGTTTCTGTPSVDATPEGTRFDITFEPPLVLANDESCRIDFDISIVAESNDDTPDEIDSEAVLSGACVSGLSSGNVGTARLLIITVPALGAIGLIILALLVIVGPIKVLPKGHFQTLS